MKKLKKVSLTVRKGKIENKEVGERIYSVADNVADNLLIQANQFNAKNFPGLAKVEIWEEVEVKTEKPKREKSKSD